MKIAVDENIPLSVVNEIKNRGIDVLDIRGTHLEGIDDEKLWEIVQAEKRLFLTTDKGFSQHRKETHFGIIIVNLKHPNSQKIYNRIFKALDQFDSWKNRLIVMRDTVQSVWVSQNN